MDGTARQANIHALVDAMLGYAAQIKRIGRSRAHVSQDSVIGGDPLRHGEAMKPLIPPRLQPVGDSFGV